MTVGKPVMTTKHLGVMKGFGEDKGVIYVAISENVLRKAFELIEEGTVEKWGLEAMKFVGKNSRDDIVADFEGLLEKLK